LHDAVFSCFGTVPACDKQTNGQTHNNNSICRAITASCGKNATISAARPQIQSVFYITISEARNILATAEQLQ